MYLVIFGTVVLALIIYLILKPHLGELRYIPEPPRWPLLTYNTDFMYAKDKLALWIKWAKVFKDGVFKMNYPRFGYPGYHVYITKSEFVKQMFGNTKNFTKSKGRKILFPLMGDGILIAEGKDNAYQKRLLLKAFTPDHVKTYIPAMNVHAKRLIQLWNSEIDGAKEGKNIALQNDFSNLVFDIFCDTAFGHNYDSLSHQSDIVRIFKEQMDTVSDLRNRILVNVFPFLQHLPFFSGLKIAKKNKERCQKIVEELVLKKKELLSKSDNPDKHNDLLSMMIKAHDDETKTGFTDKLVRDNIFTLMVASFETTGAALPWVMYTLAMHPEEQKLARSEIAKVIEGKDDIEPADISNMPYLSACIKEAMRLHTPVPLVCRVAKQATEIGGYKIPAGQAIWSLLLAVHRQEEIYPEPEKFRPERFMSGAPSIPASYVTFGYGPYNCIGQHFAMMEMKVLVAQLLRKFDFLVDPEFRKYDCSSTVTIKPRRDLTLRLVPIDSQ